jgi:hypothetical protein
MADVSKRIIKESIYRLVGRCQEAAAATHTTAGQLLCPFPAAEADHISSGFLMSQDFFSYIQVHLSAVNDVRPTQKEEDMGQSVGRS